MQEISENDLRMITIKSGIHMQFAFKEIKLFEVLSKILALNQKANLDIVMKGGTALNKIYLKDVQRFSEDIDFDIFSNSNLLKEIVSIEGFELEGPWRFRNTIRYYLNYSFFGQKDNIRVEFSTNKIRKMINDVELRDMFSAFTKNTLFRIPVYSLDDLLARKMNALRDRTEGKDIWDSYHAIPKSKNLKKAIKSALESEESTMTTEESVEKTLLNLKKADAKNLMKSTNMYIPVHLRPKDWNELIQGLIQQLESLLDK